MTRFLLLFFLLGTGIGNADTARKNFTTALDVGATTFVRPGHHFTYSVGGTFSGTVVLERSQDGKNWTPVQTFTSTASERVNLQGSGNEAYTYRFRCSAYTSGTIETYLTEEFEVAQDGRLKYADQNVAPAPTIAELTSLFGSPAARGKGFVGVVNDNAGGTTEYIVWTDGTNWFYVSGTKAL